MTKKEVLVCNSCNKGIANQPGTVQFKCPNCSKDTIIRCVNCREIAAKYRCDECSFEGPN